MHHAPVLNNKWHKPIILTVIITLLILVVAFGQFKPINIYYNAVFTGENTTEGTVDFDFSGGKDPSASKQSTQVSNNTATIRVDPLNNSATSLAIHFPGNNITLDKITATVTMHGRQWYTVMTIFGNDIAKRNDGESTIFTLSTKQLESIRNQSGHKSEIKLFLIPILLVFYVITLARMTVFKATAKRFFVLSVAMLLLFTGFLANLWLIKEPITLISSYKHHDLSLVQQDDQYSIKQVFVAQKDTIRDIYLPITVTPNIGPSDTSDSNYKNVYISSDTFAERYIITVLRNNGTTVYSSSLTPSMMNDSRSTLTIPINIADAKNQKFTIFLEKTNKHTPSLLFSIGTKDDDSIQKANIKGIPRISQDSILNFSIGYNGFPYQQTITTIIIFAIILLSMNLKAISLTSKIQRNILIIVNYGALIIYSIFQFIVYGRYVRGFPDEPSHISYIAYLKKTGKLIPSFADMGIYSPLSEGTFDFTKSSELNYLGHPPFYYHLMRLLGGMTIDGNIADFNLTRLRIISFLIGFIGILIVFYLGFTRITNIPILHLLFGLLIISPPNVIYIISGVSNDSMAILGVSIFTLGVVRFIEKRYSTLTYYVIAFGIGISLLAKLTAGMIACLAALFVVLYSCIQEHNWKAIIRPQFIASIPIYLVPAAYFAVILRRYHTIQPSYQSLAFDTYIHSTHYTSINVRGEMGVWEYINHFFNGFFNLWHSLAGHVTVPEPNYPIYALDRVAVMAVLLAPALIFIVNRNRVQGYISALVAGVYGTILYQLYKVFNEFHDYGQGGANSSRYYCCAVSIFALAIMWMIMRYFSEKEEAPEAVATALHADAPASVFPHTRLSPTGNAICAVLVILLLFDGFIYSVLWQAGSIPGFTGA